MKDNLSLNSKERILTEKVIIFFSPQRQVCRVTIALKDNNVHSISQCGKQLSTFGDISWCSTCLYEKHSDFQFVNIQAQGEMGNSKIK